MSRTDLCAPRAAIFLPTDTGRSRGAAHGQISWSCAQSAWVTVGRLRSFDRAEHGQLAQRKRCTGRRPRARSPSPPRWSRSPSCFTAGSRGESPGDPREERWEVCEKLARSCSSISAALGLSSRRVPCFLGVSRPTSPGKFLDKHISSRLGPYYVAQKSVRVGQPRVKYTVNFHESVCRRN